MMIHHRGHSVSRRKNLICVSSFCPIACRGVSHTPESVHVDKLVHLGVCDTPLQGLFVELN